MSTNCPISSKKNLHSLGKAPSLQIKRWFAKHYGLILLILLHLFVRLYPIWGNNFAFMYDHAKDQLIIRQMGKFHKPALYGAVTSIDGVYNGPAWYYLALPLNILGNYHPMASVLTIVVISTVSLIMLYYKTNLLTALLYATSTGIIGTQNSAWTPYMTPLLTMPIILILFELVKKQLNHQHLIKLFALMFLLASLSFHFQTAYAVVLLPTLVIILAILYHQKLLKITKKTKLWQLAGIVIASLMISFSPWLIFELRHNFNQSKQIINFISNYSQRAQIVGQNKSGPIGRSLEIGNFLLSNASMAVNPSSNNLFGLAITIVGLYLILKKSKKSHKIIFSSFIGFSFLAYLVLPCKSYYFVAITPVWVVFVGNSLNQAMNKKVWKKVIILLIIVFSLINVNHAKREVKNISQQKSDLFSTKLASIQRIYQLSEGKNFSSYHYVKDVYDYPYQYVYLYLIDRGYPQPIEFNYEPNQTGYILQKELNKLDYEPELIFLLTEEYIYPWFYEAWWNKVTSNLEIRESHAINDAVNVYLAKEK